MRWPSALEWALGALAVVCLLVAAWNFDPFGRRKHAQALAQSATRQASTDQATVKALDHAETKIVVIREKSERAVDAVQAEPGAETPLPDDVRDAWLNGLRELRASPDQPDNPPDRKPPS